MNIRIFREQLESLVLVTEAVSQLYLDLEEPSPFVPSDEGLHE